VESEGGAPVVQIADLRLVHPKVFLVFPHFPAEHYLHDIHTAVNRCKAQNQTGILSAGMSKCGPVSSHEAILFHTTDSGFDRLQFPYCLLYRDK
jgi:hypothetical protein